MRLLDYSFRPMNKESNEQIVDWHYQGVYAFYDQAGDEEDLAEFVNPNNWDGCYTVHRDDGELVGYFSYDYNKEQQELRVGLGMRPDLTGRGLGEGFVQAGLEFGREKYNPEKFVLQVAEFNKRAIRVYERAGFEFTRRLLQKTNGGEYWFIEMTREV